MDIFKNYKNIATTNLRQDVLAIIEAGLQKINPVNLIVPAVKYNKDFNSVTIQNKTYDILNGRIFVVGGGKASGYMAEAIEEIIGSENITAGFVNCISAKYNTKKIKIIKAEHPLPGNGGIKGVKKMLELKDKYKIGEKDLVICLISGGASAMMPYPADGIKLKDKQKMTSLLMGSGASIQESNIIRKHLSKIKGGRLAEHFYPAQVASLIISDVIGDKLEIIGSGPTVPDTATFRDALDILIKYDLLKKTPKSIIKYIELGCAGKVYDTPKKLDKADNFMIGNSSIALETMAVKAKSLGFKPVIVTSEQVGDPGVAAKNLVDEIKKDSYAEYNVLLLGGETTPKLPDNHGQGGRNQHYVANFMLNMGNFAKEWAIASLNSDGKDYVSDIAGAIVDHLTLERAQSKKIEIDKYISKFDTYSLFKKIGNSLIETGDTGTNIGDVAVVIIK